MAIGFTQFRALMTSVIFIALTSVCTSAIAMQPMRFETLSVDDGLSQGAVKAILQDSRGYLWLGTEDGLNVYDGYGFQVFRNKRDAEDSLSNDFIATLAEDAQGNIWIGTDGGGVVIWLPEKASFVHLHELLEPGSPHVATYKVQKILVASDGAVWIATRGDGLLRVDTVKKTTTTYHHDPENARSIAAEDVWSLMEDRQQRIWVGTEKGLNRFAVQTNDFDLYLHDSKDDYSLSDNSVRSLAEDHRGAIWIGTRAGGLNRFVPNVDGFVRFVHDAKDNRSITSGEIEAIIEDDSRRLWVGTRGGLSVFDRQSGYFYRYQNSSADPTDLPENHVISLYQDRSGLLWVGFKTNGVAKWNPRSWALGYYKGSNDGEYLLDNVASFAEDADGTIWIGSIGSGLATFDRQTGEILAYRTKSLSHIEDKRIMALATDHDDNLWIGTMQSGLTRYNLRTGETRLFKHEPENENSLGSNGVMSLLEDADGAIWVGSFGGGVARYDAARGDFSRHNVFDEGVDLSKARVTALAEDHFGAIWVGTDGHGLTVIDPAANTAAQFMPRPYDPDSISSDIIWSVHVDDAGTVWAGSRGVGLDRVLGDSRDPQNIKFQNWSEANGLPNDVVYGIRSDGMGRLWLSTNRGLSRLDVRSGSVKNYRRSHGLQGDEFNFGAHFRTTDGELFFGGPNGFNTFLPERLERNDHQPQIVITQFTKFNKAVITPLSKLSDVRLAYEDDVITFEFAGLDYTAPEENRYAYKLEGFDSAWVSSGDRRRATYTNLAGGNYTFRVLAANSDGVWNSDGVSIPIRVDFPPWLRWWAFAIYLLLAIAALLVTARLVRARIQREADYSHRLEEEVQQRTQELADRNDDLNEANGKLQEASLTDPLTLLRNRRFLFEEVIPTLKSRHPYDPERRQGDDSSKLSTFFMMVDLDHFKPINDTHGHDAGDQMLTQVTESLLQNTRSTDHVIRWGGDEFLIVSPNSTLGDAESMAERVRAAISRRVYALGNGSIARTTCSIGFAAHPFVPHIPDLLSWQQVMKIADAAVYRAKESRNAWAGISAGANLIPEERLCDSIVQDVEKHEEVGTVIVKESSAMTGVFEMRKASGPTD